MIFHFNTLGSTNDEATAECYTDGDVVVAECQTKGRGQRGHTWISGEGLNLTFSVVLEPFAFEMRSQFLISQITALALCDVMRGYGIEARIKWTNDIYVGDKKIVGILIENKISSQWLRRSVVGVGININQMVFDPSLPNPTSMAIEGGCELDRDEVLNSFLESLASRYEQLKAGDWELLRADYNALLYRRGELYDFRLASGELSRGAIQRVEPAGELVIAWEGGAECSYLFREVEFVI